MFSTNLIKSGRLAAFNGVGFFKLPGQIAAIRPDALAPVRTAATTPGLWLPKLTQTNQEKRVFQEKKQSTFTDRSQLKYARRLVVKLGSAVITREDEHGLALGRLASIVEQVAECQNEGRECIMVTSGAVAFGKQKLTQELLMSLSMRETLSPTDHTREDAGTLLEPRAAAAVGQSGLMSLYDAMFAQYGVKIAQVLVTKPDFYNEETRRNLFSTLSELISLNIVPIINTNDAVSPPPQVDEPIGGKAGKKGISIKDNDSLAAMLAAEVQSDLLILMSDVDGIYNKPPWEEGARFLHTFTSDLRHTIEFGQKSKVGTGGMDSKVNAATWALDRGVSVVICNGMQEKAIKTILSGRKVGTFFTDSSLGGSVPTEVVAENGK
jgi:delta-1-pyrroline-5-carboxylate synthetase